MRPRTYIYPLLAVAVFTIGDRASGQAPMFSGVGDPSARELIVGDWYTIDVQIGPVRERLEGDFAKANDHWIVLRRISEGRHEVAVPVSEKVPALKTKKTFFAQQTEYLWIPRPSATIVAHTAAVKRVPIEELLPEVPTLNMPCHLTAIRDGKAATFSGRLYDLNNEHVVLKTTRRAYEKRSIPYLGELPFVGRAFFSRVTAHDEVLRDELPARDVVCIRFIRHRETQVPPTAPAGKP